MTAKFIKGLVTNRFSYASGTQPSRIAMKLLYEFWGFCVNGGSSLTTPGGFANNGLNLPVQFTSSFTLLASGNDGYTDRFSSYFTSNQANFIALHNSLTATNNAGLLDKFLVIWKSGSTSRDDSIYRIKSLIGSNTISLDVTNGGTLLTGSISDFSTRTSINYRLIDLDAVKNIFAWSNNNGMVLAFSGSLVNTSQATAHVNMQLVSSSVTTNVDYQIVVSPSGTWNGTTFTDISGTTRTTISKTTDTASPGIFYVIADKDFLIWQMSGFSNGWGSASFGCHIEIPKRIFPASLDPNPITWLMWNSGSFATSISAYNKSFKMIDWDSTVKFCTLLTRSPYGSPINSTLTQISGGVWHAMTSSKHQRITTNQINDYLISSDCMLHVPTSGSFTLARVTLKNLRLAPKINLVGQRFGNSWIHVGNGVLWPWDNSEQHFGLLYESNAAP